MNRTPDAATRAATRHDQNVSALEAVCKALCREQTETAGEIITTQYPFVPIKKVKRTYTPRKMLQVFVRDGFIDRYSGRRLVCPPVLRLIHKRLKKQFPFHPNWRLDSCHFAFWELLPTLDHIIPVSRGGTDDEDNWVTTSMVYNAAKAHWTLEELGWPLLEPGDISDWDGLLGWFAKQTTADDSLRGDRYFRTWDDAAREVLAGEKGQIE